MEDLEFRCDGMGRSIECTESDGWAYPYCTYVGCCVKLCQKAKTCPLLTEEERSSVGKKASVEQPKIYGL